MTADSVNIFREHETWTQDVHCPGHGGIFRVTSRMLGARGDNGKHRVTCPNCGARLRVAVPARISLGAQIAAMKGRI